MIPESALAELRKTVAYLIQKAHTGFLPKCSIAGLAESLTDTYGVIQGQAEYIVLRLAVEEAMALLHREQRGF